MSYHIIHITQHASRLSVDRGCLVLTTTDEKEKRAPLIDILAIVVAARGVSFSGESLSAILKNGGVIIHCDENYRPLGKTIGLSKIVHSEIFQKQIKNSKEFCDKLWQSLIKVKVENQAEVLNILKVQHIINDLLLENIIDEANIAKYYWKHFFSKFAKKAPKQRERQYALHPINQMLNYIYAVMGAIVHRSIVAHGLNANLGIHHKFRFKSDPLLYDLMEPLRPFCDLILYRFATANLQKPISDFVKFAAKDFVQIKLKLKQDKTFKIINAIDKYISSVADCFYSGHPQPHYIPKISDIIFSDNK